MVSICCVLSGRDFFATYVYVINSPTYIHANGHQLKMILIFFGNKLKGV